MRFTLNELINDGIYLDSMLLSVLHHVEIQLAGGKVRLRDLSKAIINNNVAPFKLFTKGLAGIPNVQHGSLFMIDFKNNVYTEVFPSSNCNYCLPIRNLKNCLIKLDYELLMNVPNNGSPVIANGINIYNNIVNSKLRLDTSSTEWNVVEEVFDGLANNSFNTTRIRYGLVTQFIYHVPHPVPLSTPDVDFNIGTVKKKPKKVYNLNKIIEAKDIIKYDDKEYPVKRIIYRFYPELHGKDFLVLDNKENEKIKYRNSCTLVKKFKIAPPIKKKKVVKKSKDDVAEDIPFPQPILYPPQVVSLNADDF